VTTNMSHVGPNIESGGCTQSTHAVHGVHAMYSVTIPRSVGY
jgi:hypothetical protein